MQEAPAGIEHLLELAKDRGILSKAEVTFPSRERRVGWRSVLNRGTYTTQLTTNNYTITARIESEVQKSPLILGVGLMRGNQPESEAELILLVVPAYSEFEHPNKNFPVEATFKAQFPPDEEIITIYLPERSWQGDLLVRPTFAAVVRNSIEQTSDTRAAFKLWKEASSKLFLPGNIQGVLSTVERELKESAKRDGII